MRTCPDQKKIQQYLLNTGHQIKIPEDIDDFMDWVFGEDEENITLSEKEENIQ